MNYLFISVILPGILWDCIKTGTTVSSEILNKKIKRWFIRNYMNENILDELLVELQQKNISSKNELKRELRDNFAFKQFINNKNVINSNNNVFYINIFGFQNINKSHPTKEKAKKQHKKIKQSKNCNVLIKILLIFIVGLSICTCIKYIDNRNYLDGKISDNKKYWDGKISDSSNFGGGTGKPDNPFIINSPNQLAELSYLVENGIDYKNTYFKLTNNLYLNNMDDKGKITFKNDNRIILNSNMEKWTPIGSKEHPFSGYFDGNNKAIYGLYIEDNNRTHQGLFGYCNSDSTIINLSIKDYIVYVKNGDFIGGICGQTEGLLDGCLSLRGYVGGNFCVGGIVGEGNVIINSAASAFVEDSNNINKTEKECHLNRESLSNRGNLGGITGKCNYLINSVSYSWVIAPTYRAGGLAGEVVMDMYNCICERTFIDLHYFSIKYIEQNNMPFLYGVTIGVFNEGGKNIIPNHCIYSTTGCALFRNEKELLSNNPDYPLITQQYNSITEKIDYNNHESVIKKLNNNIKYMSFAHTDIEDILNQYGTGGTSLYLKKWVHSKKHNVPVLEGMNIKGKIFVSISDI